MNEKIKEKYFGTEEDYKNFKEAVKELRYEIGNENTEVQDMVNFIEDLMDKFKHNFDKAIQEATDKAKKEELNYWNKVRSRKGHVDDNSNGIKERILWLKEKRE